MLINQQLLPYLGHLEEFRRRLLICLAVMIISLPICWPCTQWCIDWLWHASAPSGLGKMVYSAPLEMFFVRLKLSFILAICIASPVLIWHITRYVYPALYANERRIALVLTGFATLLFIVGASFALFVSYPLIMRFSYSLQSSSVMPLLNVSSCVGMVCWLMLGFGICFQLPVVVLILIISGIVSSGALKRIRPYVILGIFIVAAILTPPDVVSLLLMALPSWLLFELSLILAVFFDSTEKKNKN